MSLAWYGDIGAVREAHRRWLAGLGEAPSPADALQGLQTACAALDAADLRLARAEGERDEARRALERRAAADARALRAEARLDDFLGEMPRSPPAPVSDKSRLTTKGGLRK